MKPVCVSACLLGALFFSVAPVFADGGYFYTRDYVGELVQTRQEVLLAIHRDAADTVDRVTYVLRSDYDGDPSEFAWVIPVPNTPEDVIAHEAATLFDSLDDLTGPRFSFYTGGGLMPPYQGCGCAGYASLDAAPGQTNLVEVEASGQAGIFDWFALTSTGSTALLNWLNDNDFAVPSEADPILDQYIQQGMHFLALRISQPDQVEGEGDVQIPPIQFTCQTSQRIYPMVISRISAADQTEVLIYVLAEHRAEAANVPNAEIPQDAVAYDPSSPSLTNYESVFSETIAGFEEMALVTEYAAASYGSLEYVWLDAPAEALKATFITRLRSIITPEQMSLDLEFQDATDDQILYSDFWVSQGTGSDAAAAVSQPLALLLLFGLFRTACRRCSRRTRGSVA